MLQFTGYPANCNFAAPYKVLLRKRGLLTPASRSYAPEQHGVQVRMNSNVNIRYSIHMTMISFSRNSRSFIFIGSISKNFLVNFFVLWFDKYRKRVSENKGEKKYASF